MEDKIAAETAMGAVTLRVADLDAMIRFYTQGVTLSLLSQEGPRAVLGRGAVPVVILEHAPELRHATAGSAGLFHTAIVFDSEPALAAAVYSVARYAPGTFTGSADHLVSKAFYFTDPEGNGVELYWDRDRSAWSWTHGQVEMDTLFLDPNEYLREHLTERVIAGPLKGAAQVGHVHLSVGDLAAARDFYVTRLGFDTTLEYHGSALFVSAGGYHHHLAMNTWNSRGAGRRAPGAGRPPSDWVASISSCPRRPSSAHSGSASRTTGIPSSTTGRRSSWRIPGRTPSGSRLLVDRGAAREEHGAADGHG